MLLLVLILVVLAFGLLVFAPQAGSVLAAWAAVALSAIAGIVLLIDWMQRRSAMRAGAASLEAAGNRPPSRDREWEPEPEPATEVLPVIPPGGPPQVGAQQVGAQQGGQVEGPTALTPRPDSGAPERGEDAVDPRFDDAEDSQQTVLMPAVQPPGSSARPSSATHGTTGSSGSSSPSVTETASEAAAGDLSEDDATTAEPAAEDDAPATVLVDTRKRPANEAPTAAVQRDPDDVADPVADPGAPVKAEAEDAGTTVVAAATAAAPPADPTAGRTGDSNLSGSDLFGAGEQRPQQAAAWQPPGGPEQQAPAVEQTNGTQSAREQATQATPVPESEPTTEQSDPAEAALAATLEDEVVVIDEQPRYHVPGCEALTAHEPIPLPAREAVELGFTPCGWCRPNHTLAERHPAATR